MPPATNYWSQQEDLGVPLIQKSMSRNRFTKIKSYLHFRNNNELNDETKIDKGFKIRPLLNMVNDSIAQFGVFEDKLSVDETMVKYFGKHSIKQFIRGKPIRFGYKFWNVCSVSDYCFRFDLYCGQDSGTKCNVPLGLSVVQNL